MLTLLHGDAMTQLKTLESESVQTCVTSPPYWGLRDYGVEGQLGLEKTPEAYVGALVDVFREVKRVLRADGTLWLNLGDSYAGNNNGYSGDHRPSNAAGSLASGSNGTRSMSQRRTVGNGLKNKDLVGIPWMVAFALRADGWYLRSDIIWSKPNPMPESVTDRPTKSHEYIFLLAKSGRYYFDQDAVKENGSPFTHGGTFCGPGEKWKLVGNHSGQSLGQPPKNGTRNIRSVWTVATQPFTDAHFATFPPKLIEPCILAGAPIGGVVLDPFAGSGTTGKVAIELGRRAVLIEPKAEYVEMIERRCKTTIGLPLTA